MDTLAKLAAIRHAADLYSINFRTAGVGFTFYEGPDDLEVSWREKLVTHAYHPTFEAAVAAEFMRLGLDSDSVTS